MVIALNQGRTEAGTEDLSENVAGYFAPWETTIGSKGYRDSTEGGELWQSVSHFVRTRARDGLSYVVVVDLRTQMGAGNTTSSVDTSHNTDTPSV